MTSWSIVRRFHFKDSGTSCRVEIWVYKVVESYLIIIVNYGVVLLSIGALFWCIYRRGQKNQPYHLGRSLPEPGVAFSGNDLEGALMNRPAVALPSSVR